MTIVDFVFDFASPNAYFSHKVVGDIADRTGATFNYVPCLLGGIFKSTGNQSPIVAYANIPNKLAYEQLEIQRFIDKHHLTEFQFNAHFPVNTLLLMRGAVAAEADGRLMEYVNAGFAHMWEASRKMDDPEVFAAAFNDSGFDGEEILKRTQDPAIKAKLIENTDKAVKSGAFGVPTFFVGDDMFFGKDRLGQVEEAVLKAR